MGKRGRGKRVAPERFKNVNNNNRKTTKDEFVLERDMDDEIDAFHKQKDFVPMDVNGDGGDSDSDDDDVVPVLDHKDLNGEDDEDDDDGNEEEYYDPGLAKKIAQQQRFLRQRIGGVDDAMDDDDEDEEDKIASWGPKKNLYYHADNVDNESDNEELDELEEKAAEEMLYKTKKDLKMEDVGLSESDEDDSDVEPTLEERAKNKDAKSKSDAEDALDGINVVPRDLSDLPLDEQLDAVNSSAPELVSLLSELSDAHSLLESEINPLINEVKKNGGTTNEGMHYLEVKQLLLLSYCQAITFYLLLKSEGQSTHDHPVLDRIAQIKDLRVKTKELDKNLPSDYEDIIKRRCEAVTVSEFHMAELASPVDASPLLELDETEEPAAVNEKTLPSKTEVGKENRTKAKHEKHQDETRLGHQSKEMLKFRASLEDKLRQKGILNSAKSNTDKTQNQHRQKVNGQFETFDDYNDDHVDDLANNVLGKGTTKQLQTKRLSELVTSTRTNKPKIASGEDDLVDRGDIGQRRHNHELRVLRKAGIKSEDGSPGNKPNGEDGSMEEGNYSEESEDEFYKQVKKQKIEKLASKQKTPSRDDSKRSVLEETIDGKRHISYQMEKNRGLTRSRKKLIKNPRKKYKLKHQKAVVARKGQVRDIRKHTGPYGGETSGINARISRSIRLKG